MLEFIHLGAIIVLVLAALIARKIPFGRGSRMFAGWAAIFFAAFVIFSFKDRIIAGVDQLADQRRAESTGARQGAELRISQAIDGHFWVTGGVNGTAVRFLIDSGATITSISRETASSAGVELRGGFPVLVGTANGTIEADRARIKRLQVGHIVREDQAVHVSDAFGDMNVLGMNFLSSLKGWRVEGRNLILTP